MIRYVRNILTGAALISAGFFLPTTASAQANCSPVMTAETAAGAMVRLSLSSECHADTEAVIHHNGMMISITLDESGVNNFDFPAMTETALFMAEFPDGAVAIASTEVASLSFYDRVALQWQGEAGLELHAYEFGAEFNSEDHVWRTNPRSMDHAALGEGGFLVSLGNGTSSEAYGAEVYTFPTATSRQNGSVTMNVEVVVTEGNCGQTVEASALNAKQDQGLNVRNLTIEMPDCDAVGDILMLNNLVEDLIIGSN